MTAGSVGRLKGIPGVFSQGQTLEELEDNIRDAYQLMLEDEGTAPAAQDESHRHPGMNRQRFIRELEQAGCVLHRHGAKHDIYRNPATNRRTPVPRHREIKESLGRLIRKQLGLAGSRRSIALGQQQGSKLRPTAKRLGLIWRHWTTVQSTRAAGPWSGWKRTANCRPTSSRQQCSRPIPRLEKFRTARVTNSPCRSPAPPRAAAGGRVEDHTERPLPLDAGLAAAVGPPRRGVVLE